MSSASGLIFERAKFNKRKQEDSENVENFVTSLYTLSEHCGYNDLREEMIRDRIVVGIKDANLSVSSFLLVKGLLWSRHRLSFPLISRLRLYGIDSRITQIVPH
jgi:hypothetical protein